MCKQMMSQRQEIEADIKREVERCEASIRKDGHIVSPSIVIDLENLFIANKFYFEENGFCFEDNTRIENGRIRYYAIMRPSFNGKMAENIRKKMREAQKEFAFHQRVKLQENFNQRVRETGSRSLAQVLVNMSEIVFENKGYFEDEGYYFEPIQFSATDNTSFNAWMKVR